MGAHHSESEMLVQVGSFLLSHTTRPPTSMPYPTPSLSFLALPDLLTVTPAWEAAGEAVLTMASNGAQALRALVNLAAHNTGLVWGLALGPMHVLHAP